MLKQVTPFVLVKDMNRALGFYEGVLGFSCGFRTANYAFVRRDGAALRLLEVDRDLDHPEAEQSCYIDVEDVDTLYTTLKAALDTLPKGRVRAPFDQDYGQREFHVIDEDCMLLFFGAPIHVVN